MTVIGWDIGGVNTKAARVHAGTVRGVVNQPYELQRAPARLTATIRQLAASLGDTPQTRHAVTMTAELSQMFRTKRDGVNFVLDAVTAAADDRVSVYCTDGVFRGVEDARRSPLLAAAANWRATAQIVASYHADALLVDIGTTTTDIIPIVAGRVVAEGRTDVDRLASGELVYSGALRTPIEAILSCVTVGDQRIGVSAEAFALIGDVHLYRGDLAADDYSVPTPDGRPADPQFARERLARVICGDRELLDERAIAAIAESAAAAQVDRVASAIRRVCAKHPAIHNAVVTGLGDFVAAAAARAAGLGVIRLAEALGADAARCAPAAAVALLLEREWSGRVPGAPRAEAGLVDAVIKIGGGSLTDPDAFAAALAAVQTLAARMRIVIVPGGGPFADAVRDADQRVRLSRDATHWMAVLAMDQYAELLAWRIARAARVESPDDVEAALRDGRIPILAPARWLRQVDPLPHSWDVTSDSIAAWVCGELGARLLVLIKPAGATGDLLDRYFTRALPPGVTPIVVPADRAPGMLPEVQ